jgi:imidazolonepropionase-like amidohydrolase
VKSQTSEKSLRFASSAVAGPANAARFVAERVLEGDDSIKVIVEDPGSMGSAGLDVATIAALVEAAHQAGLKVIAHISVSAALRTAADAGVDIIAHSPLTRTWMTTWRHRLRSRASCRCRR